jgi:hypothetical protein
VYDTWSLHYENDGIQENKIPPIYPADAGTNGLDDNGDGVIDDLLEYDTLPPYPSKMPDPSLMPYPTYPLRGVRITVRVYEPSSQQIREIVVTQDFPPD